MGLEFMKGRLFSKKSLNSPCSFLVPDEVLVNPRAAREVRSRISVIRSREIFSPGANFFSSSLTCLLYERKSTQLLRQKLDRMSSPPSPELQRPHFAF